MATLLNLNYVVESCLCVFSKFEEEFYFKKNLKGIFRTLLVIYHGASSQKRKSIIGVWKGPKYALGSEERRFSRPSSESNLVIIPQSLKMSPKNYPISVDIGMKVS